MKHEESKEVNLGVEITQSEKAELEVALILLMAPLIEGRTNVCLEDIAAECEMLLFE